MDVNQRRAITQVFKSEGKLSPKHLFRVKKRDKDNWNPMPGNVITTYLDNDYEFEYLGPNTKETLMEHFSEPKAKKGRAA